MKKIIFLLLISSLKNIKSIEYTPDTIKKTSIKKALKRINFSDSEKLCSTAEYMLFCQHKLDDIKLKPKTYYKPLPKFSIEMIWP